METTDKDQLPRTSPKILFVEDEMRIQKIYKDFFKKRGFDLIPSYDGIAAVRIAEEKNPDLILLDLILPGKDGFEVMKELKSNPRMAGIPIIILTNLEGAEHVERAVSLGARAYLVKANYSLKEVIKKIKEII